MALQYGKTLLLTTGLGAIDVGERQNPPTEQQVQALADLFKQDGEQRQPILVRRVTSNTYKVVCGATRLQAARCLGWHTVKAQIVSGLPIDYQIAELSDDISFKSLTREQQAESKRKLKELHQKAAADAGSVEKAKGGRGKRGGVAEAARQAGVSRYAAMRANKPVRNEQSAQVSDQPKGVKQPAKKKRRTIEDFQADIGAKQARREETAREEALLAAADDAGKLYLDDDGNFALDDPEAEAICREHGFLYRAEQSALGAEINLRNFVPTKKMIQAAKLAADAWTTTYHELAAAADEAAS